MTTGDSPTAEPSGTQRAEAVRPDGPDWFRKISFFLLAGAFLTLPMNTLRVKGVPIGDIFLILLFCLFPLTLIARRFWKDAVPPWLVISAALLIVAGWVTLLFPVEIDPKTFRDLILQELPQTGSTEMLIRLLLALVAMPIVIAMTVRSWRQMNLLATFWVVGASLSCAVALFDAFLGTDLQLKVAYDREMTEGFMGTVYGATLRNVGLTDHPNILGITAVMAAPVAMFRLGGERGFRTYAPILALLFSGLVLSGSRLAVIGFLVGLIGAAVLVWRPALRRTGGFKPRTYLAQVRGWQIWSFLSVLLTVAILGALVASALSPSLRVDFDGNQRNVGAASRLVDPFGGLSDASNTPRKVLFESSVKAVSEAPIGGIGYRWIENPHNIVLAFLLSGGILALLGYGLAMGGYLVEGFRARREAGDAAALTIGAAVTSVCVFLVSEMFGNHTLNRYLYLPMGLILAARLLVILDRRSSRSE